MRAPDDIAWEHASCPHHAHVSIMAVTAHGEAATVEAQVRRVFRGSLVTGQMVSFTMRLRQADDFSDASVTSEWLERQTELEVCLTESLELPSSESSWALDGPSDEMHLQLPPACTACPEGFLKREFEAPTWAQRRPDVGCALAAGSVGLVGLVAGLGTLLEPVLMLMPVGLLMLVAGLGLTFASLRNSRSRFTCIRCGVEVTER